MICARSSTRSAAVEWPAPRDVIYPIAVRLGWRVHLDRRNGINFQTSYAFGSGRADSLLSDGDIAEVTVHVSERIDKEDTGRGKELAEAFTALRGDLEQILGRWAHERRGANPRVSWDLDNGGRVALERLGAVVSLYVLQKKYADIERSEEKRGVPEDRDPEADLV